MGCCGLDAVPIILGVTGAGAVAGSLFTFVGTPGLLNVSQIFADKEKECQEDSNAKLAYKIAKWAFVAFAAIVGTVGALAVGFGTAAWFFFLGNFDYTIAKPISLIAGITTAVLLEVLVIKNVWQQVVLYNQPDLSKTV